MSKLTLDGKLVGKAHVNALVGSYLQYLESLPTSRSLQDELVGKGLDLVGKSNRFARNSYARLFHRGPGAKLFFPPQFRTPSTNSFAYSQSETIFFPPEPMI